MYNDTFSRYHPIINMLYFALVIGLTMFLTHPACLMFSFGCAFAYSISLKGKQGLRSNLIFMLPLLLFTALLNPAFSHQGVTILTYLPSSNPLTLESIVYGAFAAFLLISVIVWFSCFNVVMTSDKFVYLFGRIIPALSLVLAMALRFVPRFAAQIKVISNAQRCIGRDLRSGGLFERARHGIKILSVMITWALENAIDTADSMKNRGYGLPGRTAFSIFRFAKRDRRALIFLFFSGGYVIAGAVLGELKYLYYPAIGGKPCSLYLISLLLVWLALAAMPIWINVKEHLKWKAIQAQMLPSKT